MVTFHCKFFVSVHFKEVNENVFACLKDLYCMVWKKHKSMDGAIKMKS